MGKGLSMQKWQNCGVKFRWATGCTSSQNTPNINIAQKQATVLWDTKVRQLGRKSCIIADNRQSRERKQIEGLSVLGTAQLNLAYPPMLRGRRRYAHSAWMPSSVPETLRLSRVQAVCRSWNMSRSWVKTMSQFRHRAVQCATIFLLAR